MEDKELMKKKLLLSYFGIDPEQEEYAPALELDIQDIYARLVFLEEVGTYKYQDMTEKDKKELQQLLTASTSDFARSVSSIVMTLIDRLTPEQKTTLKNFDAEKYYDIGDKRETHTLAKGVKRILRVAYPYDGSVFQKKIDIDSEGQALTGELYEANEPLENQQEIDRQVTNAMRINQMISDFTGSIFKEYGILDNPNVLPKEEILKKLGEYTIKNASGVPISADEFYKIVTEFFEKLKKMLEYTHGEILSSNLSTGGSKRVEIDREKERVEIGAKAKKDDFSGFIAIRVRDRVILEPIGQYANRTYIVPFGDIDKTREYGRKELIRSVPGSIRINHKNNYVTASGKIYAFDDHLFKCMQALHEDKKELTGEDLKKFIKSMRTPELDEI